LGILGIGVLIEGAMQQAAQPSRQPEIGSGAEPCSSMATAMGLSLKPNADGERLPLRSFASSRRICRQSALTAALGQHSNAKAAYHHFNCVVDGCCCFYSRRSVGFELKWAQAVR